MNIFATDWCATVISAILASKLLLIFLLLLLLLLVLFSLLFVGGVRKRKSRGLFLFKLIVAWINWRDCLDWKIYYYMNLVAIFYTDLFLFVYISCVFKPLMGLCLYVNRVCLSLCVGS